MVGNEPKNEEKSQQFPPWSVRKVLLWAVLFIILLGFGTSIVTVIVEFVNIVFECDINQYTRLFIGAIGGGIFSHTIFLIFVIHRVRKASFSFRNIWISYDWKFKAISGSLLLGLLWGGASPLVQRIVIGIIDTPATSLQIDRYLSISLYLMNIALVGPVVEEVFFRGVMFQVFDKAFSTTRAVLFSSLIFSLCHIDYMLLPTGQMLFSLIETFLFGVVAAMLFKHTQSLNNCIVFHSSANLVIGMIDLP